MSDRLREIRNEILRAMAADGYDVTSTVQLAAERCCRAVLEEALVRIQSYWEPSVGGYPDANEITDRLRRHFNLGDEHE